MDVVRAAQRTPGRTLASGVGATGSDCNKYVKLFAEHAYR
jgi:hypothetical protein